MITKHKIQALVGCQNLDCAEEVSFPLDMVRLWNGAPVCRECHECGGHDIAWDDLPAITLGDLSE